MKKQVIKPVKPLTSLFLDKDKRSALTELFKVTKDKYASYEKDDVKRLRLKRFSYDMYNSLQNEFYMTANICDNSIWKWQDKLSDFDSYGYLYYDVGNIEELSDWAIFVKGWYNRNWAVELLKLIKDFNLDSQEPDYVTVFMNDFKSVKNEEQFCSAVLKWTDLIHWSPWKLSLYDNTFPQPVSAHYDDDFNPEVDSDAILD